VLRAGLAADGLRCGSIEVQAADGSMLASIDGKGAIRLGESVEPDEAAAAFWSALGALRPRRPR
jgi:hypothetical protein